MSSVCLNIPETVMLVDYKHIGYHRKCCKRLTIHVSQLNGTAEIALNNQCRRHHQALSSTRVYFLMKHLKPKLRECTDLNIF